MKLFYNKLQQYRIVPVVVVKEIEDTIPTLQGLMDGGLPVAEITFRTECASAAIKLGTQHFPDMLIGAGTILTLSQAKQAIACGAKFIVSPGLDKTIALYCKKKHIPYIPGCVTPTEIMEALHYGIKVIKFFPAAAYGGLDTIKALSGPFPQVQFLPTGGINLDNMQSYLSSEHVIAVGGSFMMKGEIAYNTRKIMQQIKK